MQIEENQVDLNRDVRTNMEQHWTPKLGMVFDTTDEAWNF